MAKPKTVYVCQHCAAQFPKWGGQCTECQQWNTIAEEAIVLPLDTITMPNHPRFAGYAAAANATVTLLAHVSAVDAPRMLTGMGELDRVLGGGLVEGSVVLMGGDPGIGKSTLLLQTLCQLSEQYPALYVTGEESLQQVKLRAERLNISDQQLRLLAETQVERILAIADRERPAMMVIDSIQTLHTEWLQTAPGAVGQVRESAAQLVRFAKQSGTALFLVGHVTKDGSLAGPRVLEHMVDTVLYFEGESDSRFRMIRAVKNRFGAVNELGLFAMTDKGVREVNNPSAMFLSRYGQSVPGSVVMVTWEGSRPLLVEVQALVNDSHMGNPRRITVGLEQNRLAMLLAVLHRHGGIATYDQDVFVNVVGGIRVTETAADLALVLSVLSSLKNKPLPNDLVVFGEIGLAGEIRPVQSGQERLRELVKHGFKRAIIPHGNAPKGLKFDGLEISVVQHLNEALQMV